MHWANNNKTNSEETRTFMGYFLLKTVEEAWAVGMITKSFIVTCFGRVQT
jgi:hypothetical protein